MTRQEAQTIVLLAEALQDFTGLYLGGTYQLVLKALTLYPDLSIAEGLLETLKTKEAKQ